MYDQKLLDHFPLLPGVYLMKNQERRVIYVGKAKELKKRVKQYFLAHDTRPMIPYLLKEIASIETIVVETEKEALLLENTLIKKHKPKYNATLKDDKTFVSLMINIQHKWPKLQLIRYKGKPRLKGLYFGPYTSAFAARQTYEVLSKIFPLRQCSDRQLENRARPCLLYGIKRCIAPCTDECTKQEYDTFVQNTIDFLNGKDEKILKELIQNRDQASEKLAFEQAASFQQTIAQLEHVTSSKQIIEKMGRKDTDAIGLYRKADEVILMLLMIRDGKLCGSEHYSFFHSLEEDHELLCSFLLQYYPKKKDTPKEILLPLLLPNEAEVKQILKESLDPSPKLLCPAKGEKKKLVSLAKKNAKATFAQEHSEQEIKEKMLLDLVETLSLSRFPRRIECFDTSNISGADPVASMVAFTDGNYDKKRGRYYHIRMQHTDDYSALRETLTRRLRRAKDEDDLPDLILIDGGKGQLNIGLEVLKALDIASVDVACITKEEGKHTKGMTKERVFVPGEKEAICPSERSAILFFLQQIRDQAHQRAITFHRKKRSKRVISTALGAVDGIGPIKQKRLLSHFGSLKRILEATDQELLDVKGITKKDVEALRNFNQS